MDCKEIVKCIKFLLYPYKYINIMFFLHYYISQMITVVLTTTGHV